MMRSPEHGPAAPLEVSRSLKMPGTPWWMLLEAIRNLVADAVRSGDEVRWAASPWEAEDCT